MSFFSNRKQDKNKSTEHVESQEKLILDETKENVPDENISDDTEKSATSIQKTTITEEESKEALFREIADYLNSYITDADNNMMADLSRRVISIDTFMTKVIDELERYEAVHDLNLTEEDEEKIISDFKKKQFGYDIIEDYLNDDSISDIKILGPDSIRIKKDGKRISSTRHFKNKEDYLNFASRVALKNSVNTGINNAIQIFTDKTSCDSAILRIDYTTELINSTEMPYICFRKIPKEKRTLDFLVNKKKMMDERTAEYLKQQVVESSGILFTGKGASGKTTLMNALLDYIPLDKSGLVIQESEELFSEHPDIMFQHIVTTKGDGTINYSLGDLAVNGLLTDIDYFVIGEIKGEEASKFMTASYTGTKCWASVHGTSSQDAINKLADYVKWSTDYSLVDIFHMLRFMKVVIFMKDYKVWEISEITGVKDDGTLEYKPIVKNAKWVAG